MAAKITISPGACFFGALLIMTLPLQWWLGAVSAAVVHEVSHMIMIRLTGAEILKIKVGPWGTTMETLPMSRDREVLCAAAGPFGSFLFTAVSPILPEAAVCAAIQAIFNLLPIFPMDGGRILHVLAPKSVCTGAEVFTCIMLLGTGIWYSITLDRGILPIIPGCVAVLRVINRKFPCKETKHAVQ